ncbi:MAG: alpha/beta hydrolase-fold protein [bacterium]
MKNFFLVLTVIVLHSIFVYSQTASSDHQGLKLRLSYTKEISQVPFNARVIVGFQKDLKKNVSFPNIFKPQPTFAWDIENWIPGESILFEGSNATSWMGNLDSLDGWYIVQCQLVKNKKSRPNAEGTFQPKSVAVTNKNIIFIDRGKMCMPVDLLFTTVPNLPKFKETEFIKHINIESKLMSDFYGEKDSITAAVILPPGYFTEPEKLYATVYVLGGWGSSPYYGLSFQQKRYGMTGFGDEKIFVFVNHECRTGYHNFCSSETNGPREETFLHELIPCVEKEYRVYKNPETRFLMGQSSGAWASLWMLINYPGQFGGAYVSSPDPVDFTEFVGTNIYEKNANLYFDSKGELKRFNNFKINPEDSSDLGLSIKDFVAIDRIAGWGEQMYSFNATFSNKDLNGEPQHLFDWSTGAIDNAVADSWKKFDMSIFISELSLTIKQLLNSKIHIYVADDDSFGLNVPVKVFKEKLNKSGIDAEIIIFPKGGHDVWTDELRKNIYDDMDRKIRDSTK